MWNFRRQGLFNNGRFARMKQIYLLYPFNPFHPLFINDDNLC